MKSVIRDGRSAPRVEDVPRPAARAGHVLVRTTVSLVSAGTERSAAAFAGMSLAAKAAKRPDLVRQVMDKVRRDGLWDAQRAVRARLGVAESLGYSAAGIVLEDGTGLFPPGTLVACAGGGHAAHAEVNLLPRNLIAAVPAGVSADDAAFATVGSVALHAVRLARVGLGDAVAVLGLGLLGQITAQLLGAAGCVVFGLDPQRARTDLAAGLGCDHVATDPLAFERLVRERTADRGVDAVIVAASAPDSRPIATAAAVARGRARLVVLGDTQLHLDRRTFYEKELKLAVSRSYGPGRYDRDYEERGVDYPYEYVRWTLRRNLEAFLGLAPQLRLAALVTHRFDIAEAGRAYDLLLGRGTEPALAILLRYPDADPPPAQTVALTNGGRPAHAEPGISVVGAGTYARATLLPALARLQGVRRTSLVTAKGLSAWDAGRRFGFASCSTDLETALGADTSLVVVATRHGSHAALVRGCLARGKAVLCEKPVCVTEEELDELVAAYAAATRPFVVVGYNRRFAPLVIRLRERLAQVGRPLVLSYRVNAGGVPRQSWLRDDAEGCGRLVGEACHFVDLLSHLAGAAVRRVHAVRPGAAGESSDPETFTALLEFDGGAVGTLVYSADGDPAHPKERLEIVGGGAVAVLDDFRELTVTHRGRRERTRAWGRDKGHAAELAATVDALRNGGPEPVPFGEAVAGMRALFAIRRALATGAPVDVEGT
jgi:predicted dehydrogenase/threonine dehydrogenase-like Zn-dependent dehydrogenase